MKTNKGTDKRIAGIPLSILLLFQTPQSGPNDYFSWQTRVDRHGMPAGHYAASPFPITESTESYTIMNDEYPSGRTYALGDKVYVDGGYTGTSTGTWAQPWKTIGSAIENTTPGNKTILVRGPHDGFAGTYGETSLSLKRGTDDTHRWMICGYGQERPILNGQSQPPHPNYSLVADGSVKYATIQRVKIQDNYGGGIRFNNDDSCNNVVDVWLYNNDKYDFNASKVYADGNLYFLGSDYNWIFHSTTQHTYGHGFKIGDDARYATVEWSVGKETGYWDGFPLTSYFGTSATAFDFPNGNPDDADGDGVDDRGVGHVIRYNIVHTSLYYGMQIRRCPGFSIHHNEIYNTCKFDDVDMSVKGVSRTQVALFSLDTYGDFYCNVVRDPGSRDCPNISLGLSPKDIPHLTVNLYNNIIYGGTVSPGVLGYGGSRTTGISIGFVGTDSIMNNVFNNTLYSNTSSSSRLISVFYTSGSTAIRNNVLYLNGPGSCVEKSSASTGMSHSNNLYYVPNGGTISANSNYALISSTELDGDPQLQSLPEGEYSPGEGAPTGGSPTREAGMALTGYFMNSFNGVGRPWNGVWDIGAYEFANTPCFSSPPHVLIVPGAGFNYQIQWVNPIGGTERLSYIAGYAPAATGWVAEGLPGYLSGTVPAHEGIDSIRAVLSVDGTPYDTLDLEICIGSTPTIVRPGDEARGEVLYVRTGMTHGRGMYFDVGLPESGVLNLGVYDVLGRKIWTTASRPAREGARGQRAVRRIHWPNANLGDGMYIVVAHQQDGSVSKGFRVMR